VQYQSQRYMLQGAVSMSACVCVCGVYVCTQCCRSWH